jgi:hypothetical protein
MVTRWSPVLPNLPQTGGNGAKLEVQKTHIQSHFAALGRPDMNSEFNLGD